MTTPPEPAPPARVSRRRSLRGDRLVLVTDGGAETLSPSGEYFGRERLLALLDANRSDGLQALADRVAAAVDAHRGTGSQQDDITLLIIEA
jgi:phosphoserine phosphatase RsbU/P